MKKTNCPHCLKKVNENLTICPYCFEKITIDNINQLLHLYRQLRLAVSINNIEKIINRSQEIINIEPDNNEANYYFAYGHYRLGNHKFLNLFLERKINDYNLENIVYHMIRYDKYLDIHKMKIFIYNNIHNNQKKFHFLSLLNHEEMLYDHQLPLKLMNLFELKESDKKNLYLSSAISLIIFGLSIMAVLYFFILNRYGQDVIYFSTVLLFTIPSIFIAMGITRLILKQGKRILTLLLWLIVVIVSSYIVLIPFSDGFITHIEKVFTAPYDLLNYFIERVSNLS